MCSPDKLHLKITIIIIIIASATGIMVLVLRMKNIHIIKVILINHDCLPILMLLYIMLFIVLAYLMLLAALSIAVCLYYASFLPLISANAFYFNVLS